jgi:hypothetical protein
MDWNQFNMNSPQTPMQILQPQSPSPGPSPFAGAPMPRPQPGVLTQNLPSMNENLASILGNMKINQDIINKQVQRDNQRNEWSWFMGNIAQPLAGLIPGNYDKARAAGAATLAELAGRKKEILDAQNQNRNMIGDLAKIIQASDPNDLAYAAKQEEQQRKNFETVQRRNEANRKLDIAGQKQAAYEKRIADLKEIANGKLKLKASEIEAKQKDVDEDNKRQRDELELQMQKAADAQDQFTYIQLKNQYDRAQDQYLRGQEAYQAAMMKAKEQEAKDAETATKADPKTGALINPDFKPHDAAYYLGGRSAPDQPTMAAPVVPTSGRLKPLQAPELLNKYGLPNDPAAIKAFVAKFQGKSK